MKKMELNIQLFAVNLTTQSLTEVSYDIASNTSQVRYLVQLTTTGSSYNNNNITTTYYIDGVQYTNTHTLPRTTTTTIVDRTVTITHNNDGTRSVSASFSCPTDISAGTITGSTSTQLTTIPRASSVYVPDTYIESSATITINRASNNFKHTLLYSFGSLSGTIAENVDTTYGWTVPSSFYAEIPNTKSGTCTITCITYNGSTEIGRKTTTFIASTEQLRCEPLVTAQATDQRTRTVTATGDSSKIIRYESQVLIEGTVTAKKSATLSHLYINGNEITLSSGLTTYNYSYNYTLQDDKIKVRVIDSRGYDITMTSTQTVILYFEPTISAEVKRTAPTTGEVSALFSGNFFNQNFGSRHNDMTLSWEYKKTTDSTWTTGGTLVEDTDYTLDGDTYYSGTNNSASYILLGSVFDYRYAYDIRLRAEDMFGSSTVIKQVTKGIPIINWDDEHFNVNGTITKNEVELSIPSVNVLTANLNSNQNVTMSANTNTKVNLDNQYCKVGSDLSFSSNSITVGGTHSAIRILSQLTVAGEFPTDNIQMHIYKNNTRIATTYLGHPSQIGYESLQYNAVIPISTNDKISMYVSCSSSVSNKAVVGNSSYLLTYLTVETID